MTDSNANNFSNVSRPLNLEDKNAFDVMMILQSIIASVGVLVNLLVVVVFLINKTLTCKIPNIFIINQVGHLFLFTNKCNMSNIFQTVRMCTMSEKTRNLYFPPVYVFCGRVLRIPEIKIVKNPLIVLLHRIFTMYRLRLNSIRLC